jgi:hypothetical protein
MLLEGTAIIACFLGPVWILHVNVVSRHVAETPLSIALSFLAVQAFVILLQLLASCGLKWSREVREERSLVAIPRIQGELAIHAAGDDRAAELRHLERRYPHDFDRCMASFLSLVDGQEKEILSKLARDLMLVQRWERRAHAGNDDDRKLAVECLGLLAGWRGEDALWRLARNSTPLVEAAACRLLARSGEAESATQLFEIAVGKPYLVRVLLAGELKRHARTLCEHALPAEFVRGDERRITATLEMAASWRTALRLPEWPALMSKPSPALRASALRLVPLNVAVQEVEPYIVEALEDEDVQVREAALIAVCQLRIGSTLPLLAYIAAGESGELARLACLALSRLGPEGVECLRTILLEGDPRAAARAAESLAAQIQPALSLEFA